MKVGSSEIITKVVIVGGVAGGMSAAARARRLSEKAQIIVLERSGHVSYANCGLPYYLGKEIESEGSLLLQTPATLKDRFNLDVRAHSEVIDIDPQAKSVTIKNQKTQETYKETYDDLILAVGAAAIRPQVAGIDLPGIFTLRNIEDMQAIERWIEQKNPQNVVIAGGGFIGLETAEQFRRRGMEVTLIDSSDQVLTPLDPEMAAIVHQELQKHKVQLVLSSPIKEFRARSNEDAHAPLSCWTIAGEQAPIASDLVILGLGIRPEITLAQKAGLTIGERGGIRVDRHLQTSVANIWAVGDAIEVVQPVDKQFTRIALGGPANRQGRIVAGNIFGHHEVYDGTLGTAILRIFDLTVALVGLNESQVKQAKIPFEKTYLHPSQHAGYFPGAERLDLKVLFHKETGVLLGAQIIGREGVDKRIDILATALKARLTVKDLADLELAYAPPFGSAKDPINLLGMIAGNVLAGFVTQVQWHELPGSPADQYCLLDVRSRREREAGLIAGSLNIPLPELRKSLDKIPVNKTVIVYCQSGQRSYYACRFLQQNGFAVKNLAGGYLTWKSAANAINTVCKYSSTTCAP